MIHAANNYALPKNCIVNGFPLRLTKCWLEKHLLLFRTIAFHCVGLIFRQKQRQKLLIQWKTCHEIFAGFTKYGYTTYSI